MLPLVAVIAAGLLLVNGLGWLVLVLGIPAAILYWRWDVRRHPAVKCRVCGGSGDHTSRLGGIGRIRRPFGDCMYCGGRKVHPRFMARIFDPAGRREMRARISAGRKKIKQL